MTDFTSSLKSRVSAFAENARDLTLDFEAASGSRFFDNDDQTMKEVQTLLSSRLDREKLEALRRLVALMSRGTDVSSYFASVIQLIASPNLEIKKLVYIYLLRYAESNPDLALMSINTIQKSLGDKNQIVRGMALRVMSGIKVPLISGIVILGIRRCITDLSYFVRKTAAIAIMKSLKADLIPLLQVLLVDKVPSVLSCALSAWEHVCPEQTDLLHQSYRRICRVLIEMDEWGQLVALRVLTVYVRRCFNEPQIETERNIEFYDTAEQTGDPDLDLLYKCALQLLHSRSSAVTIALTRLFQHIAPFYLPEMIPSLIRLLRIRSPEILYPALSALAVIASQHPTPFTPHIRQFYIKPTDPTHIALLKLDILVSATTESNLLPILRELNHYSKSGNTKLVNAAIRGVTQCAMKCPSSTAISKCAGILGEGIRSQNDILSTPSTIALRTLIQLNTEGYGKYIYILAQSLGEIHSSSARMEIIWLVGEYAGYLEGRVIDILRFSLLDFAEQDDQVKYQIITLAAKVFTLYFPGMPGDVDCLEGDLRQVYLLYMYTLSLARYDVSYDIRDRMRLLKNVHLSPLREAALHTPKPVPRMESLGERGAEWILGSMAQVITRDTTGQMELPEWGSEIPVLGVRDDEMNQIIVSGGPVTTIAPPEREEKKKEKKVWKDLDKFYASESEEEESEEETETEESEGDGAEEYEEIEEEADEESETDSEDLAERGGLLSLRK